MTLLAKAPSFLVSRDAITIRRPTANASLTAVTYTQAYKGRGTLGTPTAKDYIFLPETDRTTVLDATLSVDSAIDLQVNDLVDTARGTFATVYVEPRRWHKHALLRKVG